MIVNGHPIIPQHSSISPIIASTPYKIFWPQQKKHQKFESGFLVGWILPQNTICVASIIADVHLCDLDFVIDELSNAKHPLFEEIGNACGALPQVLGIAHKYVEGHLEDVPWLRHLDVARRMQSVDAWLTIHVMDRHLPQIFQVLAANAQPQTHSIEFIFYIRPNPRQLQFLSLDPIELDISSNGQVNGASSMHMHIDSSVRTHLPINSGVDLSKVVNQINAAYELDRVLVRNCQSYICRPKEPAHKHLSQTLREVAVDLLHAIAGLFGGLWPLLRGWFIKCLILSIYATRFLAEALSAVLNMHFGHLFGKSLCVKDLSATAQQVDLRLQQICFWPWQYLLTRRTDWTKMAITRAHYISFYNGMWLVANDIIFGVALGSFLTDNNLFVASFIADTLQSLTITSLERTIDWLMNWPAGLKLNSELGAFLGDMFLWLIHLWAACLGNLAPWLPIIITAIGCSGIFGASIVLALFKDLLSFLTVHIFWFYVVAARIYNWQLTILYSLFNLFRGKKRNMLRQRIDACDYDLDRLLLGTILFTLLIFLFPTILVYYLTFALGRVSIISIQAFMETMLAFLNHFPLFAIMLRIKDPERLPGGLRFGVLSPSYVDKHLITAESIRVEDAQRKKRSRGNSLSAQSSALILATAAAAEQMIRRRRRSNASQMTNGEKPTLVRPAANVPLIPNGHMEGVRDGNRRSTRQGDLSIESAITEVTYMEIENLPIRLPSIFFQYIALGNRAMSTVRTSGVLRRFASGETMVPLARLQYSLLPATRPSMGEFWAVLNNPSTAQDRDDHRPRSLVISEGEKIVRNEEQETTR